MWSEPPSSAGLCHGQQQWVWGSSGYGAILLVNCDRDNLSCDDQDNCDRHVRCLQGEGGTGAACVPGFPGSMLSYPAGILTPTGSSEGRAQGQSFSSRTHLDAP